MRTIAIASIMLAQTGVATAQSAVAERTAFRCKAGGRTIQVVRAGDTLAYRSWRGDRLEVQVGGGVTARAIWSGGGEIQVAFRNGPWTYVVYANTMRTGFHGTNNPKMSAGVDVVRDDKTVSRRRCDDGGSDFERQELDGVPEGEFTDH